MIPKSKPKELIVTPEKLWPPELLYWRRMGSKEITDYVESTPIDKRLILVVWGVLESHGPHLPVANDSHMASIAADKVAHALVHEHNIQPIIFNGFMDVGSPSATWEFPGAIGYSSHPVPVIQEIWEQTLVRMEREGFKKFFVVNGDGGNWLNHWPRLKWDSGVIRGLNKHNGLILEGANWDQEGGKPFLHGADLEHAFIKWACDFAPEFERMSALRHGFKPSPEETLEKLNGAKLGFLEDEPYRLTDWSQYEGQDTLLGVVEFSLKRYKDLLYNPNGSPRAEGGIQADFGAKIAKLMEKVLWVVKQSVSDE